MDSTLEAVRPDLPQIHGALPGPRARQIIERDQKVVSPSYSRPYPLVVSRGQGAMIDDVDGTIATPPPGMFFGPLYPWLIRLVAFVVRDPVVSAFAISTIASLVAGAALARLAAIDYSPHLLPSPEM